MKVAREKKTDKSSFFQASSLLKHVLRRIADFSSCIQNIFLRAAHTNTTTEPTRATIIRLIRTKHSNPQPILALLCLLHVLNSSWKNILKDLIFPREINERSKLKEFLKRALDKACARESVSSRRRELKKACARKGVRSIRRALNKACDQ